MANIKSAKKRARQNITRRTRNRHVRSTVRTAEKNLLGAIEKNDTKAATDLLTKYSSLISKAASKGLYHANNAARKVSRLSQRVAKIG